MAEEALVYVAGERDAYPMEFYDRQSASYQGVVPRLLEAFSARSGYQVAYYTGLEGASKDSLARNAQVDMIYSCIPARERAPQAEADPEDTASAEAAQPLVLFESELGGELVYHTITFTPAAPAGLREALEQFLSEVSTAQLNGLLLDSATVYQPPGIQYPVVVGLAVLVALLAAALAAALRCYRRRLNVARRSLETDPVTGLGNFADLQRHYRQLVNDRNRALFNMVCFSMDIDGLRLLAGSGEVDQVLKECAEVLREYVEDGALARVSESAFALMRTDTDPVQTVDWVENAVNRLRTCPQGQGRPYRLEVSAGIYPLRAGDLDLQQVVFNATQAANDAQQRQKTYLVFSQETRKTLQIQEELRASVESALDNREFQLYIQFYVDAVQHKIMGGEALSRWLHPKYGLLMPLAFVPLMEKEGLVYKLDYYCLRASCDFLQRLTELGIDDFFLSCNFSRKTFSAPDFPQRCIQILSTYSFPRKNLVFELTETIAVKHSARMRDNILALKAQGIRIVLDDFGEGFSAFSDLQQYSVDGIKLDKSLVDNILTSTGLVILRGMIQVAHDLGLTILAEGVESDRQAQALMELDCDIVQGYRYFVPVPEEEAMDRILTRYGPATASQHGSP